MIFLDNLENVFNAVLFLELARTAIIQHFRILYGDLHIIIFLQLGEDATERRIVEAIQSFPPAQIIIRRQNGFFIFSLIGTEEFILSQAGQRTFIVISVNINDASTKVVSNSLLPL